MAGQGCELLNPHRVPERQFVRAVVPQFEQALMKGEQDAYVRELMATPRRQAERLRALDRPT